jgi:UDP-GlcNAc:undecaprenyl-phosphate GlcNAc-1-phosphate transferase
MAGRSAFVGGKDHTTHHLFFKGLTEKRIALLFTGLGTVAVFLAYNLVVSFTFNLMYISIFYVLVVSSTLYIITAVKRGK